MVKLGSLTVNTAAMLLLSLHEHLLDDALVVVEVGDLRLHVVDRAIQVAGTVLKHAQPLVGARQVVENHHNQVPIHVLPLSGHRL